MQTGDIMSEIIIYQSADGRTRLGVTLENETLWLNQKQIGGITGAVVRKCRTIALSLCGSIMLKIRLRRAGRHLTVQ